MKELHTAAQLSAHLDGGGALSNLALQSIDTTHETKRLAAVDVEGALFLGCEIDPTVAVHLPGRGAFILPALRGLPFEVFRSSLYDADELFAGFSPTDPCSYCDTPDAKVYRYWVDSGKASPPSIADALARRLHDFSVSDAIEDFLAASERPRVAVMGGHSMRRDDPLFLEVVELAAALTTKGYLMLSGGGPGAMEATHIGAYLCGASAAERRDAVASLAGAPTYKDKEWLSAAFKVLAKYPAGESTGTSLGVPTWLYGHEPPTPFASHIAKYFANSVREEGLVTMGGHGVIFAPGSAGTIQEVFQDAAQNHYGTTGVISPMLFLGKDYWNTEKAVYPLLEKLASSEPYGKLLGIVDSTTEAVEFLEQHKPLPTEGGGWSFCAAHCSSSVDGLTDG